MVKGKRGRPPGKKDSKERAKGRWTAQTREKHNLPPAGGKQAVQPDKHQPGISAAFGRTGSSTSNA